MTKILLMMALLFGSAFANDNEDEEYEGFQLQGFLTTQKCAELGEFKDCYLENYSCNGNDCFKSVPSAKVGEDKQPVNIVMYSHDEGKIYNIDVSKVKASEMDEGINRNLVKVLGEYDEGTNTIHAIEFKAPPPPTKSFFKGCL